MTTPLDTLVEMSFSNENMDQNQKIKINDDERSPKRCSSSTFLEKRKRSLAHNSDDEVSNKEGLYESFECKTDCSR